MRSSSKTSVYATVVLALSFHNNGSSALVSNNLPKSRVLHQRAALRINAESNWNGNFQHQVGMSSFGRPTLHSNAPVSRSEGLFEASVSKSMEPVTTYGMPWDLSITKKAEDPLLYMKFWEWQLQYMEDNLTDLQPIAIPKELSYCDNDKKKARIVNLAFRSKEYRKIRMTYYDGGPGCQVFNSLFYPDSSYDLPVLGIDLLAFGRKKHLATVDFQPLHDAAINESNDGSWGHDVPFESLLEPIRKKHKDLQGKISTNFYDETRFFSRQMLFSRFEEESVVQESLFPAYKNYVRIHVNMMKAGVPNNSPTDKQRNLDRQSAYDTYSIERGPRCRLFAAMFGQDWADKFVYDFLFSSNQSVPGVQTGNLAKQYGLPQQNAGEPQVAGKSSHAVNVSQ